MFYRILFLTGLMQALRSIDASEGIRLEQTWRRKCLTHDIAVYPTRPFGGDCDLTNPNQEWRWINHIFLQNVGTGQCLQTFSIRPKHRMEDCAFSTHQRYLCSFNMIKSSGASTICLDDHFKLRDMSDLTNVRRSVCKWNIFGASNGESICNMTTETRKWRRLATNTHDVASGLSSLILYTNTRDEVFIIDTSGRAQKLTGGLNKISTAFQGVWGINAHFRLYFADKEHLFFGTTGPTWNHVGDHITLLDFSVPGKGFVVTRDGSFCARLQITDSNPLGSSWSNCQRSSEAIEHFSCGVTGCFAIIGGVLHFRLGITDSNPVGQEWTEVGNPAHEMFMNVEAGPVYEVWTISIDGKPYKRLGISEEAPTGTGWDPIPGLYVRKVSLGTYGPLGIHYGARYLITSNGSPTPYRQRELDNWCTNSVSYCTSKDTGRSCYTGSDKCYARHSPGTTDNLIAWRCYMDDALRSDGNVWRTDSECYYTRDNDLLPLVSRYPIFGDFERQLWLDQYCQSSEVNPNVDACNNPYFADFDHTNAKLVCRTTDLSDTCPQIASVTEDLYKLLRGSCADVPLLNFLSDSQIRSDLDTSSMYASFAKMSTANKAWCISWNSKPQDIYLEIDFRFLHKICAVATKGEDSQFVGPYNLLYSKDGRTYSYSSIFGSRFEFAGENDFKKYYLPAPVEGRFFRIQYQAEQGIKRCLKLELYGSSKEFEATSCQYYKDHLYATLDGFYNIYLKEKEIKQRVFCKGISGAGSADIVPYGLLGVEAENVGCFADSHERAIPNWFIVWLDHGIAQCHAIASSAGYEVFGIQYATNCFTGPQAHLTYDTYGVSGNCVDGKGGHWANSVYRVKKVDKKLFWALNTTEDGSPGTLIHGRYATKVLQSSNSRAIADFRGHCISDPELCKEGLSVELWLWFKSPSTLFPYDTSILRSGRTNSRCFVVYIKRNHVCARIDFYDKYWTACVGSMGEPTNWLHVLLYWDQTNGLTLIVDDLAFRSHAKERASRNGAKYYDSDSELRLGNPKSGQSRRHEIAVHSLSIWERKLSINEVESFFHERLHFGR